jgi:hypothetical protein
MTLEHALFGDKVTLPVDIICKLFLKLCTGIN